MDLALAFTLALTTPEAPKPKPVPPAPMVKPVEPVVLYEIAPGVYSYQRPQSPFAERPVITPATTVRTVEPANMRYPAGIGMDRTTIPAFSAAPFGVTSGVCVSGRG